jgi:hypothetical protein
MVLPVVQCPASGDAHMLSLSRCRVCPFMLRALHYALAKAHALQPSWLALRLSYGMNGVLLRVRSCYMYTYLMRVGI